MSTRIQGRSARAALNRRNSYAIPATTGINTRRDNKRSTTLSKWNGANTTIEITITESRKLVPQRVWAVEKRATESGSSEAPGLVGIDRLVLGAVVGEHPPDVGHEADAPEVEQEQPEANNALYYAREQPVRPGRRQPLGRQRGQKEKEPH